MRGWRILVGAALDGVGMWRRMALRMVARIWWRAAGRVRGFRA